MAARKGGRPKGAVKKIELTPERVVEDLAEMQCTAKEIASVLGVHEDTIRTRFSAPYKRGRETGKSSIRRVQWEIAKTITGPGAATMAIWLGKQYLGQTDKIPDFARLSDDELLRLAAGAEARPTGMGEAPDGEAGDSTPSGSSIN